MTQLIDLESLGTQQDHDASFLIDEQFDALAAELAALIVPPAWNCRPKVDNPAGKPARPPLASAGRYKLPQAYTPPAAGRLAVDREQLLADLDLAARRAKRDRWLAQVVALPA
ncbi:MAG: hypothetical protein KF708_08130 [Pirellulales bacterium]|nr:hypothetical protein [Pirellulales bacterium]